MKKCTNCGTQVADNYMNCPSCGSANLIVDQPMNQPGPAPVQPGPMPGQPGPAPVQPVNQEGSFGWAVLGFFIPLAGLILYCMWKNTRPGDAKKAGIGAIIGFVLGMVFNIINIVLLSSI